MGRLVAALVFVLLAVPALAATQQEIEEALTCQCGCGLTVHACNHLQCPSGEPIKKEIAERLGRGEGKEAILAAFRSRYGEKVLSAPTFRGFNWFAWVTPFAAVFFGALAIVVVIRGWASRGSPPGPEPVRSVADTELRRRLARELARMDEDA